MAEEAKETNSPLSLDLSPDTPWPVGPIEVRTRTSISDLQGLNRVLGRALHDALPENGPPMPSFAAAVSSEAEDPEDTEYLEEAVTTLQLLQDVVTKRRKEGTLIVDLAAKIIEKWTQSGPAEGDVSDARQLAYWDETVGLLVCIGPTACLDLCSALEAWVLPNAHSWAHLQCVRTLSKMAQVYPQPPVKDRITKILCRLLWKAASWRTDQARIETVPFNSLQTMSAEVIIALGAIQDTTSLPLVRWCFMCDSVDLHVVGHWGTVLKELGLYAESFIDLSVVAMSSALREARSQWRIRLLVAAKGKDHLMPLLTDDDPKCTRRECDVLIGRVDIRRPAGGGGVRNVGQDNRFHCRASDDGLGCWYAKYCSPECLHLDQVQHSQVCPAFRQEGRQCSHGLYLQRVRDRTQKTKAQHVLDFLISKGLSVSPLQAAALVETDIQLVPLVEQPVAPPNAPRCCVCERQPLGHEIFDVQHSETYCSRTCADWLSKWRVYD